MRHPHADRLLHYRPARRRPHPAPSRKRALPGAGPVRAPGSSAAACELPPIIPRLPNALRLPARHWSSRGLSARWRNLMLQALEPGRAANCRALRLPETHSCPAIRRLPLIIKQKGASYSMLRQTVCALRFLYRITLGKHDFSASQRWSGSRNNSDRNQHGSLRRKRRDTGASAGLHSDIWRRFQHYHH